MKQKVKQDVFIFTGTRRGGLDKVNLPTSFTDICSWGLADIVKLKTEDNHHNNSFKLAALLHN